MTSIALIGVKCGMSRLFTKNGESIPVTLIHVQDHTISQLKKAGLDGYSAVQLTSGKRRHVNKPAQGHFKDIIPGDHVAEFRINSSQEQDFQVGQKLTVAAFEGVKFLDISGTSIGKGFAGVIKRHNFSMGDATHGNSKAHRKAGSIGQCQDPGRVFKGKKMAGQMGNVSVTVQSLPLIALDEEKGLVAVKGAIPGSKGGTVVLRQSVKKKRASGETP
jgi:large subunit ribosomal protein L3